MGVAYLGSVIGYDKAVEYGLTPFIVGDLVKTLLAAALLTVLRRMLPTGKSGLDVFN
jgi:biotin transport system substrate-specific component